MAAAGSEKPGKSGYNSDYARYAALQNEELLREFETSVSGLGEHEAEERLAKYGHNEPAKKKKRSMLRQIISKFLNPLVIVLIIIILFSLFFGEEINAVIVLAMMLVSVVIDFLQEHRSDKAVKKLNEFIRTRVTVIRNGKQKEVDIRHIVPGDIIDLYAGDMIPADLRVISCKDLFINQSTLTGESFPVEKSFEVAAPKSSSVTDLRNIAFMGSSVVSGTGLGVVVKTGVSTQFGEISKSISESAAETSFDRGIKQFTMLMIKLMIVMVIAIFLIIAFFKQGQLRDALLFSLAVSVGLVPEMLPLLVTVNLSKGAIEMSKKKVIVKKLKSIQNFGAMDILCTDKTGTLTLDKIVLEKHCDVSGRESADVLRYAYINSLYQTGLKNLLDRAILKHEKIMTKEFRKIDEIPFDFSRKVMSVVVESSDSRLMITKGAPEEIFSKCSRYELDGKVEDIHEQIFSKLKDEYDKLSAEGFRVLALAYKNVEKKNAYSKDDEKSMILKGYLAFLDPAKPSTKKVLTSLKNLKVEVKVLTGDNELVTKKICRDVGMEITGIVSGTEIDFLTDAQLQELAEKNNVFTRLSPLQKERIIKVLQQKGHVVGYLGDGINDAPSLKAAAIGISVNNAVDIAKESADIILLEKSLMVLQDGIEEGRKTFGNIVKYVKMGASSNFGNMLSMTGAALFLPFLPMLPIQILLNNFLYDISQVAIPTDDVDKEYVEKPRPWNIDYIKRFVLFIGPLSSVFDFLTFGVLLFVFQASPQLFHTGWFIESLCTQTLIIYIIRTNKLPFIESRPSKLLMATTLAILVVAFALPFSPAASLLGFTPLPLLYFAILAVMIATYMLLVQFVKTIVVRKYGYE